MYSQPMTKEVRGKTPDRRNNPELRELQVPYKAKQSKVTPMIRTQIYLSQEEHNFVQLEAKRTNQPLAAVIRSFIDEKMKLPDDTWTSNPMLEPTPDFSDWEGHEDGAINHDHYVYGSSKKWAKKQGEWVETQSVSEDV